MMLKRSAVCIALLALLSMGGTATPADQTFVPICRHDQNASQEDRSRRSQALTLAKAINTAEADQVRRTGEYQRLSNLQNLPGVPDGFKLSLFAGRDGYMFGIKDTRDPCRYAIFSDSSGLLYEKTAHDAPLVAR